MKRKNVRALCEGAIMIAAATVLSLIRLLQLPQGGSVNISMLPIFIYCIRRGAKHGFVCTFAFGLLQLLLDGAYAWGPTSMLLDYFLAFGVLGVAGFFKGVRGGIFIGTVVGCLCRFAVHFLSGITIYRIYEPTAVFNTVIANPYIYSAVYNGSFIAIDMALCLVITAAIYKPLKRYILGEDL